MCVLLWQFEACRPEQVIKEARFYIFQNQLHVFEFVLYQLLSIVSFDSKGKITVFDGNNMSLPLNNFRFQNKRL